MGERKMSEKRNVPTFQVFTEQVPDGVTGPVVDPAKQHVADNLTSLHAILQSEGAVLVYDKRWVYVPQHAITRVERGNTRFALPWPLTD